MPRNNRIRSGGRPRLWLAAALTAFAAVALAASSAACSTAAASTLGAAGPPFDARSPEAATFASLSSPCEHRDTVELVGPAVPELRVVSRSGTVAISGTPGLDGVRVTAKHCASSRDLLEALGTTLEGGRLETRYPRRNDDWGGRRRYARIDLEVRVPPGTAIDLDDGAGSLTITDVGPVSVSDGSGSMRLLRTGAVEVTDGAGSLSIEEAAGDVRVVDRSGSLKIERVRGSVEVDDGSGSLTVRDVEGDVVIVEDGSGSIRIERTRGSVRIGDPGSGGVRVTDVGGDLTVTSGRRKRISYENVEGAVHLPPDTRRTRR